VTDEQATAMAERFLALDLHALSEKMLRQKLRAKLPDASEADLDAKTGEWLARRPGAEHGDAEGTPFTWPRRKS
jgi:hypothetical protein